MNPRLLATLAAVAIASAAASASAATTFAGNLGDPGNAALVGSDLGAALFDPDDVANNVALYTFTVASAGLVTIDSSGFAGGGVDPYFSLFSGSGPTATFVDSNYFQAYSTGGDFDYAASLAAGTYEIALGTFANMSFAENYGTGTLGDGFIGFGSGASFGDGDYALTVTVPVPEPSAWRLSVLGFAALAFASRHRSSSAGGKRLVSPL